jgi:hypothetical protein
LRARVFEVVTRTNGSVGKELELPALVALFVKLRDQADRIAGAAVLPHDADVFHGYCLGIQLCTSSPFKLTPRS